MSEKKNTLVQELMACRVNNPALVQQMQMLGFKPKDPDGGMTFEEVMVASQISNAVRGDFRSYQAVIEHAKGDDLTPLEAFVRNNIKPVEESTMPAAKTKRRAKK